MCLNFTNQNINLVNFSSNNRVVAVIAIHSNVNSSHTFIVFLILNSWETDLQKSIDFLLNPFFVFQNDLYVNLLYYMYTCCYTKMKQKFKLKIKPKQLFLSIQTWRKGVVQSRFNGHHPPAPGRPALAGYSGISDGLHN